MKSDNKLFLSIKFDFVLLSFVSNVPKPKQLKRKLSNAEDILFNLLAEKDEKVIMSKFWAVSNIGYRNCLTE